MYRGEKEGFGNLLNINFFRKKIDSLRKHYTRFPLVTWKMLLLTGKTEKPYLVRNFFLFTLTTKFLPIFQTGSLVRSQNSRMFITRVPASALNCASLMRTIFASLAHAHERVHIHNVRDFPQAKFDSEINAQFLSNKHDDLDFLSHKFSVKIIHIKLKN